MNPTALITCLTLSVVGAPPPAVDAEISQTDSSPEATAPPAIVEGAPPPTTEAPAEAPAEAPTEAPAEAPTEAPMITFTLAIKYNLLSINLITPGITGNFTKKSLYRITAWATEKGIKTIKNQDKKPSIQELEMQLEALEKGGYEHFMLNEIYEQPRSIRDCMRGRLNAAKGVVELGGIANHIDKMAAANKSYNY